MVGSQGLSVGLAWEQSGKAGSKKPALWAGWAWEARSFLAFGQLFGKV